MGQVGDLARELAKVVVEAAPDYESCAIGAVRVIESWTGSRQSVMFCSRCVSCRLHVLRDDTIIGGGGGTHLECRPRRSLSPLAIADSRINSEPT